MTGGVSAQRGRQSVARFKAKTEEQTEEETRTEKNSDT